MTDTTPATRNPNPCVALLQNREEALKALVGGEAIARFMASTLSTLRKDSKLALCTAESFYAAAHQAALLKLQPGILGEVYLVPFKDRKAGTTVATLIVGYKGMMNLIRRHPDVLKVTAECIYEDDHFQHNTATGEIEHLSGFDVDKSDDKLQGAYCRVVVRGSTEPISLVMSRADIEKRRARSAGKDSNFWRNDYPAMCRKTTVRSLFNGGSVPLSVEMREAIEYEAEEERKAEVLSVRDERLDDEQPAVDMEEGFDDEDRAEDEARKDDKDADYHDDLGFGDPVKIGRE